MIKLLNFLVAIQKNNIYFNRSYSPQNLSSYAFCANKICRILQHHRHHNRCSHTDKRHPRPAEDFIKNGRHAKGGDSLDKYEAYHAANNGGNDLPTAQILHEEREEEHAEKWAREKSRKE